MARTARGISSILAALTAMTLASGGGAPASAAEGPSKEPTVVGGTPTDTDRSPWTVYLADQRGRQFCGGAIAGANKIVTAAHCVAGESPEAVRAVAGRTDTNTRDGTVTGIHDIWIHPDFHGSFQGNDVAVLTLDRPLDQSALPLASGADDASARPGRQATIYGWGATGENNYASTTLRQAKITTLDDQQCSAAYGGRFKPGAMICAGRVEGGVDSCEGDSGGPLVADNRLIGLVSFGDGCARPGKPGVYTRMSVHHDTLHEQLKA